MPLEFTFFQKKKREDQALFVPSVAHASSAQLTEFAARLDIAEATNTKTQRHIAELMILMSDVARTIAEDASSSTRKRFCWSKWLFSLSKTRFALMFLTFSLSKTRFTMVKVIIGRFSNRK